MNGRLLIVEDDAALNKMPTPMTGPVPRRAPLPSLGCRGRQGV